VASAAFMWLLLMLLISEAVSMSMVMMPVPKRLVPGQESARLGGATIDF